MTTAREIVDALGLEPNQTCGYVRVTFGSPLQLPAGTLPHPYTAARPLGSALCFLVAPEAPVRLHRIANDGFTIARSFNSDNWLYACRCFRWVTIAPAAIITWRTSFSACFFAHFFELFRCCVAIVSFAVRNEFFCYFPVTRCAFEL